MFQQTHPKLASKNAKIAGKIIKGFASKWLINFDFNSDKVSDANANIQGSLSEISIKDFLNRSIHDDSKYNLLIFDDLERCDIEINNLLGYINNFIESDYLKVILITNENKIQDNEKYRLIKEKIIGKTFEIEADIDSALSKFTKKIKNQEIRKHCKENLPLIKDLYSQAKSSNLRILRQVIFDFERIFDKLPTEAKKSSEFIQDIFRILIAFSLEINHSRLEPKDISKVPKEIASSRFLQYALNTHMLYEVYEEFSNINY